MTLTALMNDTGPNYVNLDDILAISAPLQKGTKPEARVLMMRGGHRVYIHNSEENRAKLAHLIPEDAPMLAAKISVKPKKSRKRTPTTVYPQATQE